jgi:hypothetical protein
MLNRKHVHLADSVIRPQQRAIQIMTLLTELIYLVGFNSTNMSLLRSLPPLHLSPALFVLARTQFCPGTS